MRYLSLFSGIEAASVAWKPLGWECVAVAEIEPFPCAALAHRFPGAPNLGDVTLLTEADIAGLGSIDLIVFGSPCQDLSVAGKRAGLDGGRSGLFYTAINIIQWARKHCGLRFALWENVPGAFSSNKGRDFAAVVEQMAGSRNVAVPKNGWGSEGAAVGDDGMLEWSTLDAKWFGVAQRRRRVFALADFGDWANRPPVLLEPESLRGHPPTRREARKEVAGHAGCGFETASTVSADARKADRGDGGDTLIPVAFGQNRQSGPVEISHALSAHSGPHGRLDFESETFWCRRRLTMCTLNVTAGAVKCAGGKPGQGYPAVLTVALRGREGGATAELGGEVATALCASSGGGDKPHVLTIAFPERLSGTQCASAENLSPCLGAQNPTAVAQNLVVRRLTPTECERLQGFPDSWTNVPYRNKPAADGPRYRAIGNSMAVPVMSWIGSKIDLAISQSSSKLN